MPRLPTNADEEDLRARVMKLEWELDQSERRHDERLNNGAKTFTRHERRMEDLEARLAPKPADKWKVAGVIIGVLLTVGAWVWQAAKYPDRSEYTALQSRLDSLDDQLDSRIRLLREAQVDAATNAMLTSRDLEQLAEGLQRIEAELDKLRVGRGRRR